MPFPLSPTPRVRKARLEASIEARSAASDLLNSSLPVFPIGPGGANSPESRRLCAAPPLVAPPTKVPPPDSYSQPPSDAPAGVMELQLSEDDAGVPTEKPEEPEEQYAELPSPPGPLFPEAQPRASADLTASRWACCIAPPPIEPNAEATGPEVWSDGTGAEPEPGPEPEPDGTGAAPEPEPEPEPEPISVAVSVPSDGTGRAFICRILYADTDATEKIVSAWAASMTELAKELSAKEKQATGRVAAASYFDTSFEEWFAMETLTEDDFADLPEEIKIRMIPSYNEDVEQSKGETDQIEAEGKVDAVSATADSIVVPDPIMERINRALDERVQDVNEIEQLLLELDDSDYIDHPAFKTLIMKRHSMQNDGSRDLDIDNNPNLSSAVAVAAEDDDNDDDDDDDDDDDEESHAKPLVDTTATDTAKEFQPPSVWVYKCVSPQSLRAGPEITSDQLGTLSIGLTFVATERVQLDGVLRVHYSEGWVSETAKSGKPLLELVGLRKLADIGKGQLNAQVEVSPQRLADVVSRSRDYSDESGSASGSPRGSVSITHPQDATGSNDSSSSGQLSGDVRKAREKVDKVAQKSKSRRGSILGGLRRGSIVEAEKKAMQELVDLELAAQQADEDAIKAEMEKMEAEASEEAAAQINAEVAVTASTIEENGQGNYVWEYKALVPAAIRREYDMNSDNVGSLVEGEILRVTARKLLENGVVRVKFDRGWTSEVTASGKRLLQLVDSDDTRIVQHTTDQNLDTAADEAEIQKEIEAEEAAIEAEIQRIANEEEEEAAIEAEMQKIMHEEAEAEAELAQVTER